MNIKAVVSQKAAYLCYFSNLMVSTIVSLKMA